MQKIHNKPNNKSDVGFESAYQNCNSTKGKINILDKRKRKATIYYGKLLKYKSYTASDACKNMINRFMLFPYYFLVVFYMDLHSMTDVACEAGNAHSFSASDSTLQYSVHVLLFTNFANVQTSFFIDQ